MSRTQAKILRTHFQRIVEAALKVLWKAGLLKIATSVLNCLNQRGLTLRYQFYHK